MNWHHQIIKTSPASLFLFCLLILPLSATCNNVEKTVVHHHKNITCIDQEQDALLKFKHHIQSDNCGLMSSWGNPDTPDCCTWKGVSCNNHSGHVIGLNLSAVPYGKICLYSPVISPSLGELKLLKYLDLSGNFIQGPIPDAIANLRSLMHMDLSNNALSGSIPSTLGVSGSLGRPSPLSYLDLSANQLEGTIPASIVNLEYLGYLDLSWNNLSGDIPCKLEIREFPYYASFAFNNLSGSIPKKLSYLGPNAFLENPNFRRDKIQGSCEKHHKDKINIGLYVSIGLGFYTGFWAFCGTLTVKNSWRHAYFRFIDHIIDNIYVIVVVNLARFRRNFEV